MRRLSVEVLLLAALFVSAQAAPGVNPGNDTLIDPDIDEEVDAEGLTQTQQQEALITVNGNETQTAVQTNSSVDHSMEAFVQGTQDNLEGKVDDGTIADAVDEVINDGGNVEGHNGGLHVADIGNVTIPNTSESSEQERAAMYSSVRYWENGIIPYDFETAEGSSESASGRAGIVDGLNYIESVTCLKFVRWIDWNDDVRSQYNITHNTTLWFIDASGCWSYVGRLNRDKQNIAACGAGAVLHEAGHALGAPHENIRSDATHFLQVNYPNIQKDYWSQYHIRSKTNNLVPYDLGSDMHYGMTYFNLGGRKTMSIFDRELEFLLHKSFNRLSFYDIAALNKAYKCIERKCPQTTLDCKNKGFIGYVNGACACVCPDGLTGTTCEELLRPESVDTFPSGQYALHMSKEGCPNKDFATGNRTQSLKYSAYGHYESSLNLASGAYGSWSWYFRYDFCVSNNAFNGGDWPAGTYCIYRVGGQCPTGFQSGFKLFDDNDDETDNKNSFEGALPDGEFGNNTKFFHCCRNDGPVSTPIVLPNTAPFQLLNGYSTSSCQAVAGMLSTRGRYHLSSERTLDNFTAPYPYYSSWYNSYNLHSLYFCYYTPVNLDCGGIIDLTNSDIETVSAPVDDAGQYSNGQECTWLVKSPEDTAIKISFTKFDIKNDDYLEIRHHTITAPGARYYGERFVRSLISNGNLVMLKFVTDRSGTGQGFTAQFTKVNSSMYNYATKDYGLTYAGLVNYTQKYKKCRSWDNVTDCNYHLFLNPKEDNTLGGHNYCRNPSVAEQPWCYIDEDCNTDYCDVAGIGECFDEAADCETKITTEGYCDTDVGFEICHKSCNKCGQGVAARTETCGAAPTAECAAAASTAETYAEGDIATFTCNTGGFGNHSRMCMSDGTWSEPSILCGNCPRGWIDGENGACYFPSTYKKTFYEAREVCQGFGGDLAMPKDQAEDEALLSVLGKISDEGTSKYYIGGGDMGQEGVFKWLDGDAINMTTHHIVPEDPQTESGYWWWDCLRAYKRNATAYEWDLTYCPWSYYFMCKVTVQGNLCADSRRDCAELLERTEDMCTKYPVFGELRCKRSCGLCGADTTDITPSAC